MELIEFGRFIRTRREALQPEDVGIRRGARRRTRGLRREEVAELSVMSADYLARLERGSGPQPSEQIITSIARGLRLTIDERDHLLLLAGHQPSTRMASNLHVSPGLMRVLDSLVDTPAQVMGSLGETLAQNPTAIALFGDETHYTGLQRTAAYRWFTGPSSRTVYDSRDHEHHSRVLVSQVRAASVRSKPSRTGPLVERLREQSAEFNELWEANEIGRRHSEEKRFTHPEVGYLQLYCQIAIDPDELQTLLVFTATPGSESADKLKLLSVVGTLNVGTRS